MPKWFRGASKIFLSYLCVVAHRVSLDGNGQRGVRRNVEEAFSCSLPKSLR
jgi:hypothetical protein